MEGARDLADRALGMLPIEVPFSDGDGANPRNNSSMILSLRIGWERFLLTADAGVPALNDALDVIDASRHTAADLGIFKLPHHASRHNLDSATIERVLGAKTTVRAGAAAVSLAPNADPKYPSGRVSNACLRRGFPVFHNRNGTMTFHGDGASQRPGLVPLSPLPPLEEEPD